MKKELIKLANHLDRIGRVKEASYIDNLIKKGQHEDSEAQPKDVKNTYYLLYFSFEDVGKAEMGLFSTLEKAEDAKRKLEDQAAKSKDFYMYADSLYIEEKRMVIDPIIDDNYWENFFF